MYSIFFTAINDQSWHFQTLPCCTTRPRIHERLLQCITESKQRCFAPLLVVTFHFLACFNTRQALWKTSVSPSGVSGFVPPASPALPMICAPPPEGSGCAGIPSPTPAGILAPFVNPFCEFALDFAGGVLVDVAEGILSNLGKIGRRDVPAEVARRLIRA